jgi:hypothetical protein
MNETDSTWVAVDTSTERLHGDGPWIVDETGLLNETELAEVLELLHQRGISAIVYVAKDKGNGETNDIINQYLAEIGYGPTSNNEFPPDVVFCILVYSKISPIPHGVADCVVGTKLFKVISAEDITHANTQIKEAAREGQPTRGLKAALEFIYQQVEEDVADPTEEPSIAFTPEPKATRIDHTTGVLTSATAVPPKDTDPIQITKRDNEFSPGLVGGATATALAVAALVGKEVIRPRVEMSRSIHELIARSNTLLSSLSATRNANFLTLNDLIASSYSTEAVQLMQRSAQYLIELENCNSELRSLDAEAKQLILKHRAELANLSDRYRAVLRTLSTLNDEQIELTERINEARSKVETASAKTAEVHKRLDEVGEWYTQLRSKNDFLPTPEKSLLRLRETQSSIATAIENQATLVAYDQATELLDSICAFESAVQALVVTKDRLVSLQERVHGQSSQWSPDAPSSEAIFASSVWHIDQAQTDLNDDLDYTDVTKSVQLAEKELTQVERYVQTYTDTTRVITIARATIAGIQSQGHRLTVNVQALQTDSDKKLSQSKGAVVARNDWKNALHYLQEATVSVKAARENFESWASLEKRNKDALTELAQQVVKVDTYRRDQALPAWQKLTVYTPANYQGIEQNYETATVILKTLYDDAANPNDLISQAERLNSSDVQHYDVAELAIGSLRKEMTRVESLLHAIVAQLEKVTYAEQNIEESIRKAEGAIERARQSYAGVLDRLVTEATEKGAEEAEGILVGARTLYADGNFLQAQEKAQEALNLSIQTQQSADVQVSKLKTALSQLESLQADTRREARSIIKAVKSAPAVVVQQRTQERVLELSDNVERLELQYIQLNEYEDIELLRRVEELHQLSESIATDTQELRRSLAEDEQEYQKEQQDTLRAINSARQVISVARIAVEEPHAFSQGKENLDRAESLLPKKLMGSESYSQLREMQQNAKQAQRYGEEAEREASQRLRSYANEARATASAQAATEFGIRSAYRQSTPTHRDGISAPRDQSPKGPSRRGQSQAF